jgi:hypothetical protein
VVSPTRGRVGRRRVRWSCGHDPDTEDERAQERQAN